MRSAYKQGTGGYFSVISARPRYMPRIGALVLPAASWPAGGGRGGCPLLSPLHRTTPSPTGHPASSSAATSELGLIQTIPFEYFKLFINLNLFFT